MKKVHALLRRGVTIFVMLFLLAGIIRPLPISADSLASVSDLLSDSDISATATHYIALEFQTGLEAGDYIEVQMPASFGNIIAGNITCPGSLTASAPTVNSARCETSDVFSASSTQIMISGVSNPASAGTYTIVVFTYDDSGSAILESSDAKIAILGSVDVRASVSSALAFVVSGLATSTAINGNTTTGSSTPTQLSFGALSVGSSSILGHGLSVQTNARFGFAVTVQEDQNLTNNNGADIDDFADGTIAAPQAWASPTATLDTENTYGHFGISSQDENLTAGDTFGSALYTAVSTSTTEIMYNAGPADGTTEHKGYTRVGYRLEISALQEAGDYQNTLTYICTPIY